MKFYTHDIDFYEEDEYAGRKFKCKSCNLYFYATWEALGDYFYLAREQDCGNIYDELLKFNVMSCSEVILYKVMK
jgi:hypothetical protein